MDRLADETPVSALPGIRRALEGYRRASLPAADERLLQGLLAVKALTRRRNETDGDLELQVRLYAARLRDYPADIALAALDDWPRQSPWWPAWHDLQAVMAGRVAQRMREARVLAWLADRIEAARP
ncbi:MAG: hypothetical protein Kilf2KO_44630 [Rhodospirillales bacterium]